MRVLTYTSEAYLESALNTLTLPAVWIVVTHGNIFTLIGISGDFIEP